MTPKLKKQIEKVRTKARNQSDKWWNVIEDDDSFEAYTDYDQRQVDNIVSQYQNIVDQLIQELGGKDDEL